MATATGYQTGGPCEAPACAAGSPRPSAARDPYPAGVHPATGACCRPVWSRRQIRWTAMPSPCRLHMCPVRCACWSVRLHDRPDGSEDNTPQPGSEGETVTYSIVARDPQTGLAAVAPAEQGPEHAAGRREPRFVRAGLPEMTGRPPAAGCGWPDRPAVLPLGISDRQPCPGADASPLGLSPAAAPLS